MGYNHRGPRGRGWIKLKSLAKGSPTVFIALNISLSVLRSTSPFISLLFILFSLLLHHTLFSRFLPDSIRYASHLDLCYCRRRHLLTPCSRSLPSLCHSLLYSCLPIYLEPSHVPMRPSSIPHPRAMDPSGRCHALPYLAVNVFCIAVFDLSWHGLRASIFAEAGPRASTLAMVNMTPLSRGFITPSCRGIDHASTLVCHN